MTGIRREIIPLLWCTVRGRVLAKGFCFRIWDAKYLCVCQRTKLSGRGAHSEEVS